MASRSRDTLSGEADGIEDGVLVADVVGEQQHEPRIEQAARALVQPIMRGHEGCE